MIETTINSFFFSKGNLFLKLRYQNRRCKRIVATQGIHLVFLRTKFFKTLTESKMNLRSIII